MADYATQIAELEAILDAGASEVMVDGVKVRYDLAQVRKRLVELKRRQQTSTRRPVVQMDLTNF